MSRKARPAFRALPLLLLVAVASSLSASLAALADGPSPVPSMRDPNLLIILDASDSMSRNDPDSLRLLAAQIVVALAGPRENIAIVAFSDDAFVLAPLQSVSDLQSKRAIRADVDQVRSSGFTNYSAALRLAAQLLTGNLNAPARVIFLSDGRNNRGGSAADVLRLLGESPLGALHTIAFKDTAETKLLSEMAVATGGTCSLARTPPQLLERFQSVARSFWPYVWIQGQSDAAILPGASKIAFVAERAAKETSAILGVTRDGEPLPPDLAAKAYVYPPPDASRRWPIEIWTLDNPPTGRYALRLSPGAKVLLVLERLPFSVDFLPGKPRSLYQEAQDDAVDIAVRVAASDPDLLAALHRSVVASVALSGSPPIPLEIQPLGADPTGGAFFLLTAVHAPIDFPSAQREKAVDVLVTIAFTDPNSPAPSAAPWTKELAKTIVLRSLAKGQVTVGTPDDVKRRP
ncbi:MAG: vWA domain-containing protein [Planctomycetota bacterium]